MYTYKIKTLYFEIQKKVFKIFFGSLNRVCFLMVKFVVVFTLAVVVTSAIITVIVVQWMRNGLEYYDFEILGTRRILSLHTECIIYQTEALTQTKNFT